MNRVMEALLLEITATGEAEGVFYGPEWCIEYIRAAIEEAGGEDYLRQHLNKSWDGPVEV